MRRNIIVRIVVAILAVCGAYFLGKKAMQFFNRERFDKFKEL